MLGARPIKLNTQTALCEQVPNSSLYIQFCMAELLPNKTIEEVNQSINYYEY